MKIWSYFLKTLPLYSLLFPIIGGANLRMGNYPLLPALFLIPVYYWLVFRPDWVPLWSFFIVGLFYDALMGTELGISSLLLMVSTLVSHYMRPFLTPHSFMLMWGTFGFYSFCYMLLYGILTSGGWPLVFSWIYGLLFYPLFSWALSYLHMRLEPHV
jgi:rod shape-determining protein MreD